MTTPHSILKKKSASRAGFTLLEILIAVAIVGMLVGLAVTNTDKILGQSQDGVAKLFVNESLKTSLVRYRIDLGDYPSTDEGIKALIAAPEGKTDRWRGPYMDAKSGNVPVDPWGEAYQYRYPGTHNTESYDLFSKGRDKTADTSDDIGNW
jgi:general secretion pathway protein G